MAGACGSSTYRRPGRSEDRWGPRQVDDRSAYETKGVRLRSRLANSAYLESNQTVEKRKWRCCLLAYEYVLLAALLGAVPLAFGSGVGSELRKPLGISIIGGLLVSQVFTLFTTPVIYLWFGRIAAWLAHFVINASRSNSVCPKRYEELWRDGAGSGLRRTAVRQDFMRSRPPSFSARSRPRC